MAGSHSKEEAMVANQDLLRRITARTDNFGEKQLSETCEYPWNSSSACWAQGATQKEQLDDDPGLEPEDIRAYVAYAHAVIAKDWLDTISVAEA